MARAIWKGNIKIDRFQFPAKIYAAVEDRDIHFHLLHDQDHVRVQQRMVNSETKKPVPREKTQKGLEVEPGVFVIINESDLKKLEPEASRDIEIRQFVPTKAVNHQWYERPYWIGPDGDEVASYFEFVEALAHEDVEAIAAWTMRKRRYVGVIRADQGYLSLITLHHVEEIIPANELDSPTGRPLEKKELELAKQLVKALEAEFDHDKFRDEYRKRVEELIEAKRKGKKIPKHKVQRKPKQKSLAESLEASLHGLKGAGA